MRRYGDRLKARDRKLIEALNKDTDIVRDFIKAVIVAIVVSLVVAFLFFCAKLQAEADEVQAAVRSKPLVATWSVGAPYVGPIPETFEEEVAPVGVNETYAGDKPEAVMVERVGEPHEEWVSLGKWKITFYCACRSCSGKWGHQTSSGATCQEGITAACAILSAGSKVRIDGFGVRIIQDTGGGVNGEHIDVFYEDHDLCNELGEQYREVWVLK